MTPRLQLLLMFVALMGNLNFEGLLGRGKAFAEGKSGGKGIYLSGDVILGGLFPVHEGSKDMGQNCGHKTYNRGIQRLEAMLYAVDNINADEKLLKYDYVNRLCCVLLGLCHHFFIILQRHQAWGQHFGLLWA